MKKIFLVFSIFLMFLHGCGYAIYNPQAESQTELLDGGSIRIGTITQTTIYPWLPYYLATTIRSEILLRNIATWSSSEKGADYYIDIDVTDFQVSSFDDNFTTGDEISSATVDLAISIYNNRTEELVWSSGTVSYTENFEAPRATDSIEQVLIEGIQIALDKMNTRF